MNAPIFMTDQTTSDSGPHGSRVMGPSELLRILRRRRLIIFLTIGLILGLTALVLQTVTPLYRSEAIVIVESPEAPGDDPAATVAKARENEIRVITFLQLLQSRAMAGRVVHDLALVDDREFNPGADPDKPAMVEPSFWERLKSVFTGSDPAPATTAEPPQPIASTPETLREAVIDRLIDNVSVDQINKSNMIKVTAYSVSAEKAQRIANKLASVAMLHQIEKRENASEETVASLTKRVAELREQVLEADERVATYRKRHGITQGMSDLTQMDRLASELAGARAVRADAEARSSTIGAASSAGAAASPLLADLQTQEITLQRRIAELSAMYGQGHPDMQNAKAQLSQVQTRISEELSRASIGLQAEAAARRSREAQLAGEMGSLKARALQQGVENVALMDLERDAETNRTLYVSLLSRLKELERQDDVGQSDANFISRAAVPLSPSYPATKRIMAVALVASLVMAAILAFIAESMDGRIRTSEQMESLTGFPALAMVPEKPENWGDLPPYVAIIERPCSAFSEALRSVQQELAARARDNAAQTVVITSPLPGEGKTTLSMSLAAAAAATGIESVIVDLDLRRPGLQNMSEQIAAGPDLLDFVDGDCAINEILRWDPRVPKLAMIGVKRAAKDPGATLSSPRLRTLLEELRQRAKFIVLNTAPILPVRDAKLLAAQAAEIGRAQV